MMHSMIRAFATAFATVCVPLSFAAATASALLAPLQASAQASAAASHATTGDRATVDPIAGEVTVVPQCTSSLVLVNCDERHRVFLEDQANPTLPANGSSDLGRVVVVAPWLRRTRPEETISRLGGQLQQKLAPQMTPSLAFGASGLAGSTRDDRDGFGLSTECQMSALTCANQPGRPFTQRMNGGGLP